mmetsp:Transcript_7026/g.12892  ORF Transcript_7026/g.12892 Transcript_7026/m.12892 type:complete len:157 (+) Transcript_7026:1407-1877(+)
MSSSSVQQLLLANNSFAGTIPTFHETKQAFWYVLELSRSRVFASLERLLSTTPSQRLTNILLGDNLLTGTIPGSIGSFTRLVELRLSQNMLSGTVCSEIGRLASLKTILSLSNNRLSGTIPTELGRLTNIVDGLRFLFEPTIRCDTLRAREFVTVE